MRTHLTRSWHARSATAALAIMAIAGLIGIGAC